MKMPKILNQIFFLLILNFTQNNASIIDEPDIPILAIGRRLIVGFFQQYQELEPKKYFQKMQTEYPKSMPFFCDTKNGPGKRSSVRPNSIHQLRPGDIDIVAAMGDSLTAGHGIAGTHFLDIGVENRGMSFSIGGQETWRKYTTLPNILKEFNPNLYGYSLGNSISIDRKSKFNVAEGAAESHDFLYQSKVLKNRLIHDPKVNMTNDWKIVTTFFGGIDFCHHICIGNDFKFLIDKHEQDLVKGLRFVRDNIPRLMVNIIPPPDARHIIKTNRTSYCKYTHGMICPCLNVKSKVKIDYIDKIISEWNKRDEEIVKRDEFNNNEFTVNIIPIMKDIEIPIQKNGMLDLRYFSSDCVHFSQKSHRIFAIAYWNNLFERKGEKTDSFNINLKISKCPTEERPFIATRQNS